MVLGINSLPLDHERLRVALVAFACEVYNSRFLYVERRTAPCLPIQGVLDNGFDALSVALRCRSCDPRREVIHEGYRTTVAVDSSLYQVCVEEEEQDRG